LELIFNPKTQNIKSYENSASQQQEKNPEKSNSMGNVFKMFNSF